MGKYLADCRLSPGILTRYALTVWRSIRSWKNYGSDAKSTDASRTNALALRRSPLMADFSQSRLWIFPIWDYKSKKIWAEVTTFFDGQGPTCKLCPRDCEYISFVPRAAWWFQLPALQRWLIHRHRQIGRWLGLMLSKTCVPSLRTLDHMQTLVPAAG